MDRYIVESINMYMLRLNKPSVFSYKSNKVNLLRDAAKKKVPPLVEELFLRLP